MSDPTVPAGDLASALAGLDAARTRMQSELADARARNAALHALAAEARAAEAPVRSPRGEVEVTAGADGSIRAVRFSDDVDDLDLAVLGRLTTETIAAAQRAATDLVPSFPAGS